MAKINSGTQEIERRWLVKTIPEEIDISTLLFSEIKQWYISKKPVIRIRQQDGNEFILCVKVQGDKKSLARPEQEIKINKKEFQSLVKRSITEPIIKKRFFFVYKKFIGELDIFYGHLKGLIVIEVEFKTEKEAHTFVAPEWFGKEITGIRKYSNSALAKIKK